MLQACQHCWAAVTPSAPNPHIYREKKKVMVKVTTMDTRGVEWVSHQSNSEAPAANAVDGCGGVRGAVCSDLCVHDSAPSPEAGKER